MAAYGLLIGGETVAGERAIEVVNPATETVVATASCASETQLEAAVSAARHAFRTWRHVPWEERAALVAAVADVLEANAEELGRLLTVEQGKPLRHAELEVKNAAAFCRHVANLEVPVRVLEDSNVKRVEAHRVPLGVVAAIMPWNFPLLVLAFKLPFALLAGNTVIAKPAPTTPLATLRLGELLQDVVPPGVVNVIADRDDLGPLLTAHPDVRKVALTGSIETGRRVMATAAPLLKRLTLELGGNDAAIVLDDVDPKVVASKVFWAAFANSGQICTSIKRLYVPDVMYDELCDLLAGLARDVVVGDGSHPDTMLGPLQNRDQFERVSSLIESAKRAGRVVAGGEIPDRPGYFIPPTIVRDIGPGTPLVDEEQFGPVLPVIEYENVDRAIEAANATHHGLAATVWGTDLERAHAVAQQLEAGTVWINQCSAFHPGIPFAGAKQSGLGTELGEDGLAEFTQRKVINVRR